MIHNLTFWKGHFHENLTKQRINWEQEVTICDSEKEEILQSLKAWQLGETSDRTHLIAAATRYANFVDDTEYINAVRLFIKEEQKHGNNLGRYIDLIGEKRSIKNSLFFGIIHAIWFGHHRAIKCWWY